MTSIKLTVLVFLFASVTAEANLFRWVDDDGRVHFSDKIPPSAAQKGHTSYNKQGLKSGSVSSAEELKKQQALEEEKKEEEAKRAAGLLVESEQKIKDDRLLATYSSKGDIIRAFNEKLSLIDQSIEISLTRQENLNQKLARLSKEHKASDDDISRMTLLSQIDDSKRILAEYKEAISHSKSDKEILAKQYEDTLARFDELTQAGQ